MSPFKIIDSMVDSTVLALAAKPVVCGVFISIAALYRYYFRKGLKLNIAMPDKHTIPLLNDDDEIAESLYQCKAFKIHPWDYDGGLIGRGYSMMNSQFLHTHYNGMFHLAPLHIPTEFFHAGTVWRSHRNGPHQYVVPLPVQLSWLSRLWYKIIGVPIHTTIPSFLRASPQLYGTTLFFRWVSDGEEYVSLGMLNTTKCWTLTRAQFSNYKAQGKNLATSSLSGSVTDGCPSVLRSLIMSVEPIDMFAYVDSSSPGKLDYEIIGPITDEDDHQSGMTPAIPALSNLPNPTPVSSVNQDYATIKYRINGPKNYTQPPDVYFQYIDEFLDFLNLTESEPLTHEELMSHFSKPRQKQDLTEYMNQDLTGVKARFSAFMKRETYGKIRDARNITNPSAKHKIEYSLFTIPLSDQIKKQSWYAFGKSPVLAADRVHHLGMQFPYFQLTDFSSYDATHSPFFVYFESLLLETVFPNHKQAVSLCLEQYWQTVWTRHGLPYSNEATRLSGSPDTSVFNTINNAFVAYCVNRRYGYESIEAWARLGVYGGDDGLTPVSDDTTLPYSDTCKDLGLILTDEVVSTKGAVVFLGRVYTNPSLHNGSLMDPVRHCPKFHLVLDNQGQNPLKALACKCHCIVNTEPSYCFFAREAAAWLKRYTVRAADINDYLTKYYSWCLDCVTTPYPPVPQEEYYSYLSSTVCTATWEQRINSINRGEIENLPPVFAHKPVIKMCASVNGELVHAEKCTCPKGKQELSAVVKELKDDAVSRNGLRSKHQMRHRGRASARHKVKDVSQK